VTIASDATIYTYGSFDRADMNGGTNGSSGMPPSTGSILMTTDRIYNLSYGFNLSGTTNGTAGNVVNANYNTELANFQTAALANHLNTLGTLGAFWDPVTSSWQPLNSLTSSSTMSNVPVVDTHGNLCQGLNEPGTTGYSSSFATTGPNVVPYSNTTAANGYPSAGVVDLNIASSTLEVNCAWVDGYYTVSEDYYARSTDPATGLARVNPTWGASDTTSVVGSSGTTVNSDNFLEDLSALTLRRWGSILHMQNAFMAHIDNHDAGPQTITNGKPSWYTYWIVQSNYSPPQRDYRYNPLFSAEGNLGPLAPAVGTTAMWLQLQ
jgi:hypothetical protein